MKRFLSISIFSTLIITIGLFVAGNFQPARIQQAMEIKWACKYGQCAADIEPEGRRCKRCVSQTGKLFCKKHR